MVSVEFTGFVPAMDVRHLIEFSRDSSLVEYTWWRRNTKFVYYPYLLISAFFGMSFGFDLRNKLGLDDLFIIGDSGGFQLQSRGVSIDPVQVLRWLEKNCNVGFILDFPLPPSGRLGEVDFKKSIDITYRFTKQMVEGRKNYDMFLLNVLHGLNLEQLNMWFEKIGKFELDGWALAPKGSPVEIHIALHFSYLYDKGEIDKCEWLHIFGITGSRTLPVVYYIKSIYGKDNFSFDSSAWANGFKFRRYFSPINYGVGDFQVGKSPTALELRIDVQNIAKFKDSSPCLCPICQEFRFSDFWTDRLGAYLISLHNFYVLLQWSSYLNFLSKDKDFIKQWISDYVSDTRDDDIILAVKIIDTTIDKGFDKAYELFKEYYRKSYSGKYKDKYLSKYVDIGNYRQTSLI